MNDPFSVDPSIPMSVILTNSERVHLTVQEAVPSTRRPIVVVGNGPVGCRFLERFVSARQKTAAARLELIDDQPLIVFGEEPRAAYDRVNLTSFFEGRTANDLQLQPKEWYSLNGIELCTDDPVVAIDRDRRLVRSRSGREVHFESLILATGSAPFVPQVGGTDLAGVFVYRTIEDLERIKSYGANSKTAAVLGGGLLGLEAARALVSLGLTTNVVEKAPALMARQLDNEAASLLRELVERLGVRTTLQRQTECIVQHPHGLTLEFRDGSPLNVDMVVIAAGIRPRDELARECGLEIGTRGGIVVDDCLQTSDDNIYAIGECVCHAETVYGLVAPGYLMAETLAANLSGGEARFNGSDQSTRLKLLGVDVALCGDYLDPSGAKNLIHRGPDTYRKIIIRNHRIVGAVGVGPFPELPVIQQWIVTRRRVWSWHRRRFSSLGSFWEPAESECVADWPAGAIVCSCRAVTRGKLTSAWQSGCFNVEALSRKTHAGTVCGSCLPLLAAIANQPAEPEATSPGWRCLLGVSVLATLLIPLLLILGPVSAASSVQDFGYQIDLLWQSSFWKQVSGFTLLAVVGLALLLSLRKRVARFNFLYFGWWRAAHGTLGLATIFGVIVHTGMRLGANLNLSLMICFLTLNFAGGLTGVISALESRASGSKQRMLKRWRPRLTLLHILFFWPFPILVAFHIAAAYYL
ncbi:MAG: NAD(P)/FAD-dependent oxidoreductase [Rhodopirellula sp.]|nr:NAD(P)/FAD-dependent oxidoreductase [Rhodopirellula sp.]